MHKKFEDRVFELLALARDEVAAVFRTLQVEGWRETQSNETFVASLVKAGFTVENDKITL